MQFVIGKAEVIGQVEVLRMVIGQVEVLRMVIGQIRFHAKGL